MKKIFLCTVGAMLCAAVATKAQNNVGINTTTPDASAALEVNSTTQGMLIPRMTKAQRNGINMVSGVSTPAIGLLIYQTDDTPGFYFYDGSSWAALSGGLANGTAGGQVYLTGATAPYAAQSPQTLTGDIHLSATGVTTIADGAVTAAKIANKAVDMGKLNATGSAGQGTFLRGDGSWVSLESSLVDNAVYTAKKTGGISLLSLGVFPTGFRAVNFLAAERSVGSAARFSDADNTYIIPSTGVYQIGFTFRYGSGIQNGVLSNSPGVGIVRTRSGVSTLISNRPFSAATFTGFTMTISEAGINSIFSFQGGDRISFGLTDSSNLDSGTLGNSIADFFIYKVSN